MGGKQSSLVESKEEKEIRFRKSIGGYGVKFPEEEFMDFRVETEYGKKNKEKMKLHTYKWEPDTHAKGLQFSFTAICHIQTMCLTLPEYSQKEDSSHLPLTLEDLEKAKE